MFNFTQEEYKDKDLNSIEKLEAIHKVNEAVWFADYNLAYGRTVVYKYVSFNSEVEFNYIKSELNKAEITYYEVGLSLVIGKTKEDTRLYRGHI